MLAPTRIFLLYTHEDSAYANVMAQELARLSAGSGLVEVTTIREPTLLGAVGAGTQPNDLIIAVLSPAALKSLWLRAQVDTVIAWQGRLRLRLCVARPFPAASLPPGWLMYGAIVEDPERAISPAEMANRIMVLLIDAPTTGTGANNPGTNPVFVAPIASLNAETIPHLAAYTSNAPNTPNYPVNATSQDNYPLAPYRTPQHSVFNVWTFIGATLLTTMIIIALLFASGALRFRRSATPSVAASTGTGFPTTAASPAYSPTSTPNSSATRTAVTPGEQLFAADWSLGLSGWSGADSWQITNGALVSQCVGKCNLLAPFDAGSFTPNYIVNARIAVMSITNSDGFFGPIARVQGDADQAQGYIGGMAGLNGGDVSGIPQLSYIGGGTLGTPGASLAVGYGTHEYRLEVRGSAISLFVDGILEDQATDSSFQAAGQIGIRASADAQIRVVSLTVTAA